MITVHGRTRTQGFTGQLRRLATDEGLARGRRLAAIRRDVGIGREQIELRDGGTEGISAKLRDHRVGTLADIDGPLM